MALSVNQLKSYCSWIELQLLGAQLQDIWTDGETLVLEFYLQRSLWLCFDLHPQNPDMALLTARPRVPKRPKPSALFLSAHGKNLRLASFLVDASRGRVVELLLSTLIETAPRECRCECFLIPKNVNFKIDADGKTMNWSKPRELPPQLGGDESSESVSMDWEEYSLKWRHAPRANNPTVANVQSSVTTDEDRERKAFQQQIDKKQKAIDGILKQAEQNSVSRYFELGEWLKVSSEVPEHLKDLYSGQLSVAQNRENSFQKAKSLRRKTEGTEKRLQELREQVLQMQRALKEGSWRQQMVSKKPALSQAVLAKAQAKTRKLSLPEGFDVVVGKTAKDNAAILRQARAWDLWFHLRDFPGAYAILFRNKSQNVPESVYQKVAEWLISESVGKKQITTGIKYAVLVAECRFVKPVKGSIGLVTYQNERHFSYSVS